MQSNTVSLPLSSSSQKYIFKTITNLLKRACDNNESIAERKICLSSIRKIVIFIEYRSQIQTLYEMIAIELQNALKDTDIEIALEISSVMGCLGSVLDQHVNSFYIWVIDTISKSNHHLSNKGHLLCLYQSLSQVIIFSFTLLFQILHKTVHKIWTN